MCQKSELTLDTLSIIAVIEKVLPSSDHYCIESVAPSGDNCFTKKVAPPSDRLHPKIT